MKKLKKSIQKSNLLKTKEDSDHNLNHLEIDEYHKQGLELLNSLHEEEFNDLFNKMLRTRLGLVQ